MNHGREFRANGEQSSTVQQVLVNMSDYRPGMTVNVVGRLPAPITVRLLRLPTDETVPVLSRPDSYTGYVARTEYAVHQVGSPMVIFTLETLDTGRYYELQPDVQVLSERLRLLRSPVRPAPRRSETPASITGDSSLVQ